MPFSKKLELLPCSFTPAQTSHSYSLQDCPGSNDICSREWRNLIKGIRCVFGWNWSHHNIDMYDSRENSSEKSYFYRVQTNDRELCHMVLQHDSQYQQKQQACGELQSLKYRFCCEEAGPTDVLICWCWPITDISILAYMLFKNAPVSI